MRTILQIASRSAGTGLESSTDEIWNSRSVFSTVGDCSSEAAVRGLIEDYALVSGFSTADVLYLFNLNRDEFTDEDETIIMLYDTGTRDLKSNASIVSTLPASYGAYIN